MNEITRKFIQELLKDIKIIASKRKLIIYPRNKTVDFMKEHGFLEEDLIEAILNLTPEDFNPPPEEDRDGYPGHIYKFKTYIDEIYVYIKIRYNPPKEVVCFSFHEDEH